MSGGKNGANGTSKPPIGSKGGRQGIREAVADAAPLVATPCQVPHGFEMRADGLWRVPSSEKDMPFRVCGPFEVVAESRPEGGDEWGLLLRWKDRDGTAHEWIMPRRLLAGEAVAVREKLNACGLDVSASQGARMALVQFLAAVKAPARVRTVPRTGWFKPTNGNAVFVLPDRTIGHAGGEVVRLDMDPPPGIYAARGTLEEWRAQVAARCIGNSRLIFGVSCSFAPVLLPLAGDEGGGINLRGESSKGKTSIIDVAASVWGPPSKTGPDAFVRPWRATSNGLEHVATAHNHALLPMDEMGQADPKELGETLYMLANGSGKERARAGGGNRRPTTWITLVLSSSEESATSLAAQAGSREDHHLFAALRRFIGMHGAARFETVKDPAEDSDGAQVEPALSDGVRTMQRAGWRWQETTEKGERRWVYGFLPEVFAAEIAGPLGLEERDARARLGKAGLIRGRREGADMRWTIYARTIPGVGRPRLVVVEPRAMDDAGDPDGGGAAGPVRG